MPWVRPVLPIDISPIHLAVLLVVFLIPRLYSLLHRPIFQPWFSVLRTIDHSSPTAKFISLKITQEEIQHKTKEHHARDVVVTCVATRVLWGFPGDKCSYRTMPIYGPRAISQDNYYHWTLACSVQVTRDICSVTCLVALVIGSCDS